MVTRDGPKSEPNATSLHPLFIITQRILRSSAAAHREPEIRSRIRMGSPPTFSRTWFLDGVCDAPTLAFAADNAGFQSLSPLHARSYDAPFNTRTTQSWLTLDHTVDKKEGHQKVWRRAC